MSVPAPQASEKVRKLAEEILALNLIEAKDLADALKVWSMAHQLCCNNISIPHQIVSIVTIPTHKSMQLSWRRFAPMQQSTGHNFAHETTL